MSKISGKLEGVLHPNGAPNAGGVG